MYKEEITDEKYNNCFIVFPLLNIVPEGDRRHDNYKKIFSTFR